MKDRDLIKVKEILDDETGIWSHDLVDYGILVGPLREFLKKTGEVGRDEIIKTLEFLKTKVEEYYQGELLQQQKPKVSREWVDVQRVRECAYAIYKRKDDGYRSFMDSAVALLLQLLQRSPERQPKRVTEAFVNNLVYEIQELSLDDAVIHANTILKSIDIQVSEK